MYMLYVLKHIKFTKIKSKEFNALTSMLYNFLLSAYFFITAELASDLERDRMENPP